MKNTSVLTTPCPFIQAAIAFFPMHMGTTKTATVSIPVLIAEKFNAQSVEKPKFNGQQLKFLLITFEQTLTDAFVQNVWGQLAYLKKSDPNFIYCVLAPKQICEVLIADNKEQDTVLPYYYHDPLSNLALEKSVFLMDMTESTSTATLKKIA